ncbi:MAG TPA: Gfo/Idh/MocA family oxidoreductase [Candidatus Acidoferrales bacterium]|nr:Gfo/Idh/MocA family oxidoreductase [Candidatus Acidoferrales bacterium]
MQGKRKSQFGVAIVGAGAFGARRAAAVVADSRSALVAVADPVFERGRALAQACNACLAANWREVIARDDVDVVIVATPTAIAPEIAFASLEAGKHVLAEKPFGRSADEILSAVGAARNRDRSLKVGYNHRYHPALAKAHEICRGGAIGRLFYLRCVYGHGGRPGYECEWRGRPEISGGGQLLDQGVHALDLFRWFAGEFVEVSAFLATSYWPISPVEDNVFALLRTREGAVAQLHAGWTQWKNSFCFELGGECGAIVASGLGRSYGPERLVLQSRTKVGVAPVETHFDFPAEDDSLAREWDDFLNAIVERREPMSSGADAWRTLKLVGALYDSARQGKVVHLPGAPVPVEAVMAAGARRS